MKNILVIDDHPLVASGLKSMIESEIDHCQVFSCQNFEDANALLRDHQFEMSILDINFPDQLIFDYLSETTFREKLGALVILSAQTTDYFIQLACSFDAQGFLSKQDSPEFLLKSLIDILDGQNVYSDYVNRRLKYLNSTISSTSSGQLTNREMEILKFLALGKSKKSISDELNISVKTVDRHACNLMEKLNLHSQIEVSHYALRQGIVSLPQT